MFTAFSPLSYIVPVFSFLSIGLLLDRALVKEDGDESFSVTSKKDHFPPKLHPLTFFAHRYREERL